MKKKITVEVTRGISIIKEHGEYNYITLVVQKENYKLTTTFKNNSEGRRKLERDLLLEAHERLDIMNMAIRERKKLRNLMPNKHKELTEIVEQNRTEAEAISRYIFKNLK